MITFEPLQDTLNKMNKSWVDLYKNGIISRQTVQKIKRNLRGKEHGLIRLDVIDKICSYLDCNVEDVIKFIKDK